MPKIDFYVISEHAANARLLLACRLAEKAYLRGHTVYIEAASPDQGRSLDRLLWTFRAGSFVPHAICPTNAKAPPVTIGWHDNPGHLQWLAVNQQPAENAQEPVANTVLINLSPDIPTGFDRFSRVLEVVDQEHQVLRASRQRFRTYRDHGCDPATHRLSLEKL